MDDGTRLKLAIEKLSSLDGLDELGYLQLIEKIDARKEAFGYDGQGKLKVAFFDARSYEMPFLEEANQKLGSPCSFTFLKTRLNIHTASAAQGYKAICLFVQDVADRETIETIAKQGVRLIALRSAGFNNVDLEACKEYQIRVVRVPAYSPYAVAEHAVGLMMVLNRKLHLAARRVTTGNFTIDGLVGFDMHEKTVGIIGTGKIGQCAANILLGFGCKVLAYDKFKSEELAAKEGVRYAELEELFRLSDIISLHVPLLPETRYLIDKEAISKMKPGVMIINTSRGLLLDTKALIDGLKSGEVGSAGLDVYEEEEGVFFEDLSTYDKRVDDDVLARLVTFPNVMITSHQAFLTKEALGNIAETTLQNILEFERGEDLSNPVV